MLFVSRSLYPQHVKQPQKYYTKPPCISLHRLTRNYFLRWQFLYFAGQVFTIQVPRENMAAATPEQTISGVKPSVRETSNEINWMFMYILLFANRQAFYQINTILFPENSNLCGASNLVYISCLIKYYVNICVIYANVIYYVNRLFTGGWLTLTYRNMTGKYKMHFQEQPSPDTALSVAINKDNQSSSNLTRSPSFWCPHTSRRLWSTFLPLHSE